MGRNHTLVSPLERERRCFEPAWLQESFVAQRTLSESLLSLFCRIVPSGSQNFFNARGSALALLEPSERCG